MYILKDIVCPFSPPLMVICKASFMVAQISHLEISVKSWSCFICGWWLWTPRCSSRLTINLKELICLLWMQPTCIDEKAVLNPGTVRFALSAMASLLWWHRQPGCRGPSVSWLIHWRQHYGRTPHGTCRSPLLTQRLSCKKNTKERGRGTNDKKEKEESYSRKKAMPAQDLLCGKSPTSTPGFHQQDAITQACCQD